MNSLPTEVPMAWNSGIVTYWMPTYGTGSAVGWVGSAFCIIFKVIRANGAAFR
ncbi:hypothetical protein D3C84_1125070 [compost metagenome]